jgi:hypothetical protein
VLANKRAARDRDSRTLYALQYVEPEGALTSPCEAGRSDIEPESRAEMHWVPYAWLANLAVEHVPRYISIDVAGSGSDLSDRLYRCQRRIVWRVVARVR